MYTKQATMAGVFAYTGPSVAYVFAILGLSVLIIVHELGHMWVARLSGMRVETFSIGFGPALLRWRGRRTVYQLAMIPLGGYVQIAGMNPHEELPPDDPGSYANKGAFARIATIVAGPLTNYLTAALVMIGITLTWGAPHWQSSTDVGMVQKDSPAAKAGVRKGDRVRGIDGTLTRSVEEVITAVQKRGGAAVQVTVKRGDRHLRLKVKPEETSAGYRIGVHFTRKLAFGEISAGEAVLKGLYYPIHEARKGLSALGKMFGKLFQGDLSGAKQVGGFVEIVYQLSESFKESTALALIFLAMLSAWLALLNLLPVPALDGGRLLFLLTGVLLRRQINQRLEHTIHTIGFLLLVGLLLMVTYCDVVRRWGD